MTDYSAHRAIMGSFFEPVTLQEAFESATRLVQAGVPEADASHRVTSALFSMLTCGAIEILQNGHLELRREKYPSPLREEVCGSVERLPPPLGDVGPYKPVASFPGHLQSEFLRMIDAGMLAHVEIDGQLVVPEKIYLRFLDEHSREPLLPIELFTHHPVMMDVELGFVTPKVRWGRLMLSWSDLADYHPAGADCADWEEAELLHAPGIVDVSLG